MRERPATPLYQRSTRDRYIFKFQVVAVRVNAIIIHYFYQ